MNSLKSFERTKKVLVFTERTNFPKIFEKNEPYLLNKRFFEQQVKKSTIFIFIEKTNEKDEKFTIIIKNEQNQFIFKRLKKQNAPIFMGGVGDEVVGV